MSTGKETMGEAMGDEEGVKSLASEDYYGQQARVWKFRSENLDEEEFEVAAAGSGWMEEEDCDNFQRYFNLLSKNCCKETNKQYTKMNGWRRRTVTTFRGILICFERVVENKQTNNILR